MAASQVFSICTNIKFSAEVFVTLYSPVEQFHVGPKRLVIQTVIETVKNLLQWIRATNAHTEFLTGGRSECLLRK